MAASLFLHILGILSLRAFGVQQCLDQCRFDFSPVATFRALELTQSRVYLHCFAVHAWPALQVCLLRHCCPEFESWVCQARRSVPDAHLPAVSMAFYRRMLPSHAFIVVVVIVAGVFSFLPSSCMAVEFRVPGAPTGIALFAMHLCA